MISYHRWHWSEGQLRRRRAASINIGQVHQTIKRDCCGREVRIELLSLPWACWFARIFVLLYFTRTNRRGHVFSVQRISWSHTNVVDRCFERCMNITVWRWTANQMEEMHYIIGFLLKGFIEENLYCVFVSPLVRKTFDLYDTHR